jgi:hypothetical protein
MQVDGNYARFIAENLAYLDYRTMEEVLLVVFHLNRIIAGSGITLLHSLTEMSSRSRASASDDDSTSQKTNGKAPTRGKKSGNQTTAAVTKARSKPKKGNAQNDKSPESKEAVASEFGGEDHHDDGREPILPVRVMARASVAVEAAILLKTCLKRIYDISESKCHQFQPSSHATHKEKPVLRPTGTVARIYWQWNADQINTICDPMSTKNNAEDMARNQLGHFLELIEAESVQHVKDEEKESAKGHHHHRRHAIRPHSSRNDRPNGVQQKHLRDEREEEGECIKGDTEEGEEEDEEDEEDEDVESGEDGDESGEDPDE